MTDIRQTTEGLSGYVIVRATVSFREEGRTRDTYTEGELYAGSPAGPTALKLLPYGGYATRYFTAPVGHFEIIAPRPVFRPTAQRPAAGDVMVEAFTVPAHQITKTYEVAAWYATVEVPEQVVTLRSCETQSGLDYAATTAFAPVNAVLTHRHTPSLFGGVMVGTGGIESGLNEPQREFYRASFSALEQMAGRGEVVLTDHAREMIAWAKAYRREYDAHRADVAAWTKFYGLPY